MWREWINYSDGSCFQGDVTQSEQAKVIKWLAYLKYLNFSLMGSNDAYSITKPLQYYI